MREYLRSLATANGSEVVMPWYPEYHDDTREMWLIRQTRVEPKGSRWINYPLAFVLWTYLSLLAALKSVRENGRGIRDLSGLSRCRQFFQMLYLAWFKNLSPLNYRICYHYLDEIRTEAEHYIPPHRQGVLSRRLNAGRPTERLDHKLLGYFTLKKAGLPVVDIIDIFYPDGRREFKQTDEELSRFIGQDFFVKPVNMFMGIDASRWDFIPEDEMYTDGEGTTVSVSAFWAHIQEEARELGTDNPKKQARLVQPLILNHPGLEDHSKRSLNTLRLNVMRFRDGHTEIHDAALRMGYENEVADVRNLVYAPIEIKTGCMKPGRSKFRFGELLDYHPTTGARITGTRIPCWEEVLELAERAQNAFPENPLIGWDIAVTPEGPLIIEANCSPAFAGLQFSGIGPMTRSLFGRLYYDWMYPA